METAMQKSHVTRITQIDSKYLDDEVLSLLKETLAGAFSNAGQTLFVRFEPEFQAVLKAYLYHFTLGKSDQTAGQQLLQIKYSGEKGSTRLKYYYLSLIVAYWLRERLQFFASFIKRSDLKLAFLRLSDLLEVIYCALDTINLLVFLVKGKYPTLIERLFKLKVVSSVTDDNVRKVSYNYFTRELLWNGFADLLATILTIIPAKQFHNFICQFLPSVSNQNKNVDEDSESMSSKKICIICNEFAILPQTFGCSHIACYFCIHSSVTSGHYRCSPCNVRVEHSAQIIPLRIR